MRGILYGNLILNKKWFLASAITAVLGTAVCIVLDQLLQGDMSGGTGMAFTGIQLIVIAVAIEWLGRNLETNIKCRFTDVTLAGGISRNTFVMSELLKNVVTVGFGFVLCVIMQLVMSVFNKEYFTLDTVKTMAVLAVFCGAAEWSIMPLTISMKSAEKAGVTLGIILGLCVVLPIMIICDIFSEETESFVSGFMKLITGDWLPLIILGISAAIYVIFYFALLARVRKGDVC